jgi:hypothetical protein
MPHHIEIEVSLLAKDGAGVLAVHTAEIHKLIKHTRESIVAIGRHLKAVGELLEEGGGYRGVGWLAYLEAEFGWSDQTARRFIHIYELSRDDRLNNLLATTSDLPISVLYQLAAPKAEAARTEVAELIESGVTPTRTDVQEVLARHAAVHETDKSDPAATESAIADAPEKPVPAPSIAFPDIPPFLRVTEPTVAEPDDVPIDANDSEAQRVFEAWQRLEPMACTKVLDLIGATAVLENGSREFHKDLRAALPSNPFARLAGMSGVEIAEELSDRLSRTTINTMIKRLQARPGVKTDAKPIEAAFTLQSADWSRIKNSRH